MPQTSLRVEWPDGSQCSYYSPSTIVHEYFKPGETYPVDEFLRMSRRAYQEASDRVQAKFGFACGGASDALDSIESDASQQSQGDDVTVLPTV